MLIVQILEKAHVLGEVGAAISVAPNCTRILQSLDFDPILAETTNTGPFYEYNEEGEVVDYYNLEELSKASGAPWWYLHRADFHSELVRLATKAEKAGWAPPAVMNLDCHIVGCDPEAGSVVDKNGKVYSADVIVGSDGVHSATRSSVTGNEGKSVYSGHSAFRWLWDVEELKKDEDPEIREFVNEVKMEDYVGKDGRRCVSQFFRSTTVYQADLRPSSSTPAAPTSFSTCSHPFPCLPPKL